MCADVVRFKASGQPAGNQVENGLQRPYCNILHVRATFPDGSEGQATGFFIDQQIAVAGKKWQLALTTAHVLARGEQLAAQLEVCLTSDAQYAGERPSWLLNPALRGDGSPSAASPGWFWLPPSSTQPRSSLFATSGKQTDHGFLYVEAELLRRYVSQPFQCRVLTPDDAVHRFGQHSQSSTADAAAGLAIAGYRASDMTLWHARIVLDHRAREGIADDSGAQSSGIGLSTTGTKSASAGSPLFVIGTNDVIGMAMGVDAGPDGWMNAHLLSHAMVDRGAFWGESSDTASRGEIGKFEFASQ